MKTLHDFPIIYRWDDDNGWYQSGVKFEDIENILGKKENKKFVKWMFGQTYGQDGVYPWDLDRYLNNLPCID